VSVSDCVS